MALRAAQGGQLKRGETDMRIGIGIDTGGTYTDGVIYDFDTEQILGTAKSLTTREDLTQGILAVLGQLPRELLLQAEVLALSTTLATNACVEDRTGRAKLIFFAGDPTVLRRYGGEYGLPPLSDMVLVDCDTRFSGAVEQEPDWEAFRRRVGEEDFQTLDGVGILEHNAMNNGAVIERQARDIFQEVCPQVPAVCGHELFSGLNCLQRGSSTLLNAGLFPIINGFLAAIRSAVEQRGLHATVVMVRSDGSLMSQRFAAKCPVETLLCGPAASVLGGRALCGEPNCMVLDMGGTTTDIALIRDGVPVTVLDGVKIGRWKTFVDGLYVKTFGLGGDSAVHYREGSLVLESVRAMPLCILGQRYPQVLQNLRRLAASERKHTRFLHEHLLLLRQPGTGPRYSDTERALCRALEQGPLPLEEAAQAAGSDVYSLDLSRLVRDGVVQVCGLTPTDIMHLTGDFTAYSAEAAGLAAQFVARNLDLTVEELCEEVYDAVRRKLYIAAAEVLLENRDGRARREGVGEETRAFLLESYEQAKTGKPRDHLGVCITTDLVLLGLGAPIRAFLPEVAAMLGTRAVIPEHYQVANALGAVVGQMAATAAVEVQPRYDSDGAAGFTVFGATETRSFPELEEAVDFARLQAEAAAREKALGRGAREPLAVTSQVHRRQGDARGVSVCLGATVTARAAGSSDF